MNLTPEQRDKVVEYLDGPCQLREAADMLQVSWPAFAEDYSEGMTDAEAGRETDAATWYLSCRAARSRTRAKLRAEAHATAGCASRAIYWPCYPGSKRNPSRYRIAPTQRLAGALQ